MKLDKELDEKRWKDTVYAELALDKLQEIQDDYRDWLGELEEAEEGDQKMLDNLTELTEIDLDSALSVIYDALDATKFFKTFPVRKST